MSALRHPLPLPTIITTLLTRLSRITPPPIPHDPHRSYIAREQLALSPLTRLQGDDADSARKIMLTLHFLFPHELLNALDILDKGLVTRLVLLSDSVATISGPGGADVDEATGNDGNAKLNEIEIFFIQSASALRARALLERQRGNARARGKAFSTSRYRKPNPSLAQYEVRLGAWNCSCAAFAVSAFGKGTQRQAARQGSARKGREEEVPDSEDEDEDDDEDEAQHHRDGDAGKDDAQIKYGGISTRGGVKVPVCKHILAALSGKTCPELFGRGVTTKVVSKEELAAWAAGEGDVE